MTTVSLNLPVMRARDVEAATAFYSLLGLSFVKEKHGTGPIHFAAEFGTMVFEIYPERPGQSTAPIRLGFRVTLLDATVEMLRKHGTKIVREVEPLAYGLRAVVEDPDSNVIELLER